MESDRQLRRIERTGVVGCAVMAALAFAAGGGWRSALAVLGGGVLVAISWNAVRGGVDAAIREATLPNRRSVRSATTWRLVKFITRFAILALAAYVMMVRLRAQPWWMLAGATSLVAAPAIEVLRQLRARS